MKIEPKKIWEGMYNSVFITDEVEAIAKERLAICRTCEWDSKNKGIGGTETCTNCGCFLKWKTRSLSSSCPLAIPKWIAVEGIDDDTSNKIDEITGNE